MSTLSGAAPLHRLTVSCPRPLCNTSRIVLPLCLSLFICDFPTALFAEVSSACRPVLLAQLPGPPRQKLEVIKQSWCNPNYTDSASFSRPSSTSLPPSLCPLPQGTTTHPDLSFPASSSSNLRGVFSHFKSTFSLSVSLLLLFFFCQTWQSRRSKPAKTNPGDFRGLEVWASSRYSCLQVCQECWDKEDDTGVKLLGKGVGVCLCVCGWLQKKLLTSHQVALPRLEI